MNTNYAAPIETVQQDTRVPLAEFEELLMLWTLRSLNPAKDGFTTLSWAIQRFGAKGYFVVERVDGFIPNDHMGKFFDGEDARDLALDYWGEMVRCATPPCSQGALPGMVVAAANYIETYSYRGGYGGGRAEQSHARVGGWS